MPVPFRLINGLFGDGMFGVFFWILVLASLGAAGFFVIKFLRLISHPRIQWESFLFIAFFLFVTPVVGWIALGLISVFSIDPSKVEEDIVGEVEKISVDKVVKLIDDEVLSEASQGVEAKWIGDHWVRKTEAEKIAFLETFWDSMKSVMKKEATISPVLREVRIRAVKAVRAAHFLHTGTME